MSKVDHSFKEGKYELAVDLNEDGEKSLDVKVSLNEALEEAFKRGDEVEGAKVVSVKFELTKLKVVLDTDKDGENVLELSIDLAEAFDEVSGKLKS